MITTPGASDGDGIVRVTVGVNLTQAQALTDAITARGRDLTAPLSAQVVPTLARYFRERFSSQGAYGGQPWAPLTKRTIARRKRNGRGRGGILVDTGDLEQSLVAPGSTANVRAVTPTSLLYGTVDRTAIFAQEGTRRSSFGAFIGKGKITRESTAAEVQGRWRSFADRSVFTPRRPLVPDEGLPARELDAITAALTAWVVEGKA